MRYTQNFLGGVMGVVLFWCVTELGERNFGEEICMREFLRGGSGH